MAVGSIQCTKSEKAKKLKKCFVIAGSIEICKKREKLRQLLHLWGVRK